MEIKTQLRGYLLPSHGSQIHLAWWAWASAFTHWTLSWAQKCICFFFLLTIPSPSSFLSERGYQVAQAGIRLLCSLGWLWTSGPLPLFLNWGDYRLWLHTQFWFFVFGFFSFSFFFIFWLLQTELWLCVCRADVLLTEVSSFPSKNTPGCLNFIEGINHPIVGKGSRRVPEFSFFVIKKHRSWYYIKIIDYLNSDELKTEHF